MMKNGFLTWGLCTLALASLSMLAGCKDPAASGTTGGESGGETTGSTENPELEKTADGDTIVIGMIASRTGDLRPWGQDSIKGAQLAEKKINAEGGINGKKVMLKIEDSASKPEDGKSAAQKLAGEDVIGLIGEVSSGITKQIKSVAVENNLPLVAIGATNPDITKDAFGLVSRVCYTDDLQGPVMAFFAYDELGLRKIAVMTDQKQPYSQGLSKTFKDKFIALGGEIVAEEFYESGQTQFGAQITSLKSKAPDGIFMSGYFNEVGPMAKQIRDQGLTNVKLLGGDGWDSSKLVDSGGEAIIGGYFCNHYHNKDTRPQVQEFLKMWKEEYPDENGGVPATTMGALAYDAAMLTFDALKRASSLSNVGLKNALRRTEGFEGVSGTINLKGKKGDPPKRAIVVSVQRGEWGFVKAVEPSEIE